MKLVKWLNIDREDFWGISSKSLGMFLQNLQIFFFPKRESRKKRYLVYFNKYHHSWPMIQNSLRLWVEVSQKRRKGEKETMCKLWWIKLVLFPNCFWELRKPEDSLISSMLMFSLLAPKQIKSANWLPCSFGTKIVYNRSSERAAPCREKFTIFNHVISLFFPDVFTQHLVW